MPYRTCVATYVLLCLAPIASAQQALGAFEGQSDVGAVKRAGAAVYDASSGAYTVSGAGANMWFANDEFHFVWKKVSVGNVTITADVSIPPSGGNNHRKAALMMRQSLDPDSAYADAALHGDGLTSLQTRETKGAATREIQSHVSAPVRLRLARRGEYFYMSVTPQGAPLELSGGWMRVPMSDSFYIGLAVCAHDKDAFETARFSHVEIKAGGHRRKPSLYSTIERVPANGDRRALYIAKGRLDSASWSSDANTLLFRRKGKTYRIPAAGAASAEKVKGASHAPEGASAYFAADRGTGTTQIWRRSPSGGDPQAVTSGGPGNWFPRLSPDRKYLAYLACLSPQCPDADSEVELRVINLADGKTRTAARFTGGRGSLEAPPWSPDSKYLAFVSYQLLATK
jgi:TolB protein